VPPKTAPPAEAYAVVLVYSTGYALKVESVLKRASIPCKLIPVPRHLGSNCGSSVRIRRSDSDAVRQLIEANQIIFQGIHEL
jgi:hypothetical protein